MKKIHIVETEVPVGSGVNFNPFSVTNVYAGSPPVEAGYRAVRMSGHANGKILLCVDNGWVMNPRSDTVRGDVSSIVWRWMMIPDE